VSRRDLARVLVAAGCALLCAGCASHRPVTCRNPARVIGSDSGGYQGGWVLIARNLDPEDTAARIARAYHVRTQALTYVHGFSTFPMPQEPKFLCDKAVVEVHYDPVQGVAAR